MNFYSQISKICNSGQSRSVIVHGNVYDLFDSGEDYVPLLPFLQKKMAHNDFVQVHYELNGPIRCDDMPKLKAAYEEFTNQHSEYETKIREAVRATRGTKRRVVQKNKNAFEQKLRDAEGKPAVALELMRQFTMMSRSGDLKENLVIFIENADMILPVGKDLASMSEAQLVRIAVMQDWFCDPEFTEGKDSVILFAESQSLVHSRVSKLPQVSAVEIPSPNRKTRLDFLKKETSDEFCAAQDLSVEELSEMTASLSLHALKQLIKAADYQKTKLTKDMIVEKVEEFIKAQVGEDTIEFKKPEHSLGDVIGNTDLKRFLKEEFIPRCTMDKKKALAGAAVGGPIGAGKTFIFEAVASALNAPVIVLKNLRSQWYGQTDVVFERLRRVLEALDRCIIFVDEADTQFGSVSQEGHSTERRLTGKIQAMMSDVKLKGRVFWLLMTARIHLLSPDIRRPGRVGDLIIPVLDPEGDDRAAFVSWMLSKQPVNSEDAKQIDELMKEASAATFASLKSYLEAMPSENADEVKAKIEDHVSPNIGKTREYQELQVLVNTTRKSLIPASCLEDKIKISPEPKIKFDQYKVAKERWLTRIRELELEGIQ